MHLVCLTTCFFCIKISNCRLIVGLDLTIWIKTHFSMFKYALHCVLDRRGPTTGPRNNFAQFKSCRSQAAATFYKRHGELVGQSLALRPIPSEGFFVSREHHDFGTKVGNSEINSK